MGLHSMGSADDFEEMDRRAAQSFAEAAREAGVERIIYLGGFLGALIGSVMLMLQSVPAGLLASGVFVVMSMVFIGR